MNRKEALKVLSAGALGATITFPSLSKGNVGPRLTQDLKGNINHSASRWCYGKLDLEALCEHAKGIGLVGIDLVKPSEVDVLNSFGLKATMMNPEEFSLTEGFNDPSLHTELIATYEQLIDVASDKGVRNIICFSGNRKGLSDDAGLDNCMKGLSGLVARAEQKGVYMHMELLNSKVDHEDYQCDRTEWGVKLCKQLGSDHFKLLYDIYHMQIMEGDLIATIREFYPYFGHYHTGGVPGRNEINETQEIYYPAVMKAIVETGFKGVVAQEFIPTADNVIDSLEESINICDV